MRRKFAEDLMRQGCFEETSKSALPAALSDLSANSLSGDTFSGYMQFSLWFVRTGAIILCHDVRTN